MKNAMKINKKEVFFGAVSGVIAAIGGVAFSHILTKKHSTPNVETDDNGCEIDPHDDHFITGFGESHGFDMSEDGQANEEK